MDREESYNYAREALETMFDALYSIEDNFDALYKCVDLAELVSERYYMDSHEYFTCPQCNCPAYRHGSIHGFVDEDICKECALGLLHEADPEYEKCSYCGEYIACTLMGEDGYGNPLCPIH